jgi:hypothetical protein
MSKTREPKIASTLTFILAILLTTMLIATPVSAATRIDLIGPAGSGRFGSILKTLPSGNFVVSDPTFSDGLISNEGAVYLFDGATLELISTLTGSNPDDNVGTYVYTLPNGNYLVASPNWDKGGVTDAGAVTWCSGTSGCTGPVTTSNSLVGSHTGDTFGEEVYVLSNGNYAVFNQNWDNGDLADAGMARLCSGTSGCTGEVNSTNSLVGTQAEDYVGAGVVRLNNGNYAVSSPYWHYGSLANAGAVTWCSGISGCTGEVSSINSLVGSQADDYVGYGAEALSNGSYVVGSPYWSNDAQAGAGAATWCSGTSGCTGPVTPANSLVGSITANSVGYRIVALSNGNYIVASEFWDDVAVTNAGAVTWCSGTSGCTGPVTTTNSLVGSQDSDYIGDRVAALANGNYVVGSQYWHNGSVAFAGASTLCSGTLGCSGPVTTSNSLVGTQANDNVGLDVVVLSNGNYVAMNPAWDNGTAMDAGAATWCSGMSGCTGPVTPANSLVGSQMGDQIGSNGEALTNGNYVVFAQYWDDGAVTDAGAATWCGGTSGCTGPVTTSNSLVGSQAGDRVGYRVDTLPNGKYVVGNRFWNNAGVTDAGASTLCSGTNGCVGPVTTSNSLVGSQAGDRVGYSAFALDTNKYVVTNRYWDNGGTTDAGAVSWCNVATGCIGPVTNQNSVLGEIASGGGGMTFAYESQHNHLLVGRPAENKVTVVTLDYKLYLPIIKR